MRYVLAEYMHDEDYVREQAIDIIDTELADLREGYDDSDIALLVDIKKCIENSSYLDYSQKDVLNTILRQHTTARLNEVIGDEIPGFIPDLLIYGEIYELLCKY